MKEYQDLSAEGKLNVRIVSDIFDFLIKNRHETYSIR